MATTPEPIKGVPRIVGNPAPTLRADHNALADWVRDNVDAFVANVGSLPASGNWQGRTRFVAADGTVRRWTGAAWRLWSSPWIAFTPTLTAGTGSFVVGTGGINSSEYKWTDGDYRQRGRIVLGTPGAVVGSQPLVSLPPGIVLRAPVIANESLFGSATLFDTGVAVNRGFVRYYGINTDRVEIQQNAASAAGAASITAVSPWTWGNTDAMEYDFIGKMP